MSCKYCNRILLIDLLCFLPVTLYFYGYFCGERSVLRGRVRSFNKRKNHSKLQSSEFHLLDVSLSLLWATGVACHRSLLKPPPV